MSWRGRAAPIIRQAIKFARENGLDDKETKRHISLQYPFGQRAMHPYKIWCDEVRRQLGEKPPLGVFGGKKKPIQPLAGQKELL